MTSNHNDEIRTGKNWAEIRKIRVRILVQQDFLCERCKRDILDEKLKNHLDHIDGNPKNWRRSNLRVLCVRCHRQTPTYGHWENKHANSVKLVKPEIEVCQKAPLCAVCHHPVKTETYVRSRRTMLTYCARHIKNLTED